MTNNFNKNTLKRYFALKYLELLKNFPLIEDLPQREFAYFPWEKNYMIRHKGYQNSRLFYEEMKYFNPKHVYASAAIYEFPDKKMDEKGWIGCDFVVDIDADHMNLPCHNLHDYFFCKDPDGHGCTYYNKGSPPDHCPECNGNKFTKQQWICEDCLEASKSEVFKLINGFLTPDFGLVENDIKIVFSGHRGYHLHINNEKMRKFNSNDRRHFVDYLTGTGLNLPTVLKFSQPKKSFSAPKLSDLGWGSKIAKELLKIIELDTQEEFLLHFNRHNLDQQIIEKIFHKENRLSLHQQLKKEEKFWSIPGMGETSWKKLNLFLIKNIKCEIDIPVSIDVHRLIRLRGSIHGKTGFLVKPIAFDDLKNFNPFSDSVIFPTDESRLLPTKITAEICPKIRIRDEIYGPYNKNEKLMLPEAVSLFLACKGVALIENNKKLN